MLLFFHLILIAIFSLLALFHFAWMLGYQGYLNQVVPTIPNKETTIQPRDIACLIVAIGLSGIALFYASLSSLLSFSWIPNTWYPWIRWSIPTLFFLRVIGDFKYVGLFKKVTTTPFAKADNKVFIPLCSLISILGIVVII